jgi:hypothetical protein
VPGGSRRGARAGTDVLLAWGLGALLAAVALGAGGGLQPGPTTVVEIVLVLVAGVASALALLATAGRPLHGGGTLAAFAGLTVLTGLSITWAVQPDDAWLETNRTLAYLACLAAGIALVRLAPGRWGALLGATVVAACIVSLYALATKVFPGALNPEEAEARLREPFGYWNAVGLMAALGVPGALWLAARRAGHAAIGALAYPVLGILLTTILLAYSRGSLLAVAVGAAVWFAVVPLRLRSAAALASGAVGAILVALWAFGQTALSGRDQPLPVRAAAGHELGLLLVVMTLLLLVVGLAAGFSAARRAPAAHARRRAGTALVVVLALVPAVGIVALTLSDRGWAARSRKAGRSSRTPGPARPPTSPAASPRWARSRPLLQRGAQALPRRAGARGRRRRLRHRPPAGPPGRARRPPRPRLPLPDRGRPRDRRPRRLPPDLRRVAVGDPADVRAPPALGRRARRPRGAGHRGRRLRRPLLRRLDLVRPGDRRRGHALRRLGRRPRGPPGRPRRPAARAAARLPLGARLAQAARRPARILPALGLLVLTAVLAWTVFQPLRALNAGEDALALLEAGRTEQARAAAVRAHDIDPLSAEPLYDLAVIESAAGRTDAASAALERAVALQPQNPTPWLRLADFQLSAERDPQAALRLPRPGARAGPAQHDRGGALPAGHAAGRRLAAQPAGACVRTTESASAYAAACARADRVQENSAARRRPRSVRSRRSAGSATRRPSSRASAWGSRPST